MNMSPYCLQNPSVLVDTCNPKSISANTCIPSTTTSASLGLPINCTKGLGLWYWGPFCVLTPLIDFGEDWLLGGEIRVCLLPLTSSLNLCTWRLSLHVSPSSAIKALHFLLSIFSRFGRSTSIFILRSILLEVTLPFSFVLFLWFVLFLNSSQESSSLLL